MDLVMGLLVDLLRARNTSHEYVSSHVSTRLNGLVRREKSSTIMLRWNTSHGYYVSGGLRRIASSCFSIHFSRLNTSPPKGGEYSLRRIPPPGVEWGREINTLTEGVIGPILAMRALGYASLCRRAASGKAPLV